MKFIEVTRADGKKELINTDIIYKVEPIISVESSIKTNLVLANSCLEIQEDYDTIKKAISNKKSLLS